eukprot:gene40347-49168_t
MRRRVAGFPLVLLCLILGVLCCVNGFRVKSSFALRSARSLRMSAQETVDKKFNPREERRRILKNENYNRMGFKAEKQQVEAQMVEEFTSPLVAEMRANGGTLTRGDVTVKLAEHYGFCWGVERAIAMAYEA